MTTTDHPSRSSRILSALAAAVAGPYGWPVLAHGQLVRARRSSGPRRGTT